MLLERAGIAPETTAKELTVDDFVRLSNAFTAWEDRPSVAMLGAGGVVMDDGDDVDDLDDM